MTVEPSLPDTGAAPRLWSSLVDVLHGHARNLPDKIAVRFLERGEGDGTCLTYEGLDWLARAWAARLVKEGATGKTVVLVYPVGLPFIVGLFACFYAGAIAVPTPFITPSRSAPRIAAIVVDTQPQLILTSARLATDLTIRGSLPEALRDVPWIVTDQSDLQEDPAGWTMPKLTPDYPAFLQFTSGSTSAPRGVIVTHGNIMANMEMIRIAFAHDADTRMVSWLPLFHDMGLVGGLLQPLYLGAVTVLMSPMDFIQRPIRWLQAIARHRGTTSGGPNFAYALCADRIRPDQISPLDLSSWRVAFCGAEPVRADDLRRFGALLSASGFDEKALFPCYGMAETTLFVSGGPAGTGLDCVSTPVDPAPSIRIERVICGTGAQGQDLAIVDPETGLRVPEGEVGEVWVTGPHVGAGYWRQEEASRTIFQARIAEEPASPAYLRTGDLGALQNDRLVIVGRLKEVVIVRGAKHHPEDIEAVASRAHPALAATAAAFAIERNGADALIILQEVKRGHLTDPDLPRAAEAITGAVIEGFGVRPAEILLIRPGTLPRTTSNKIRRSACRAAYLAGDLTVLGPDGLDDAAVKAGSLAPLGEKGGSDA